MLITASGNNVENVLALGADAVFDYKRIDFEAEIIDLTASRGADLIIDLVGGSYLARNIRTLAPGGRLVQVGLLGRDDDAIIPLGTVLHNHLKLLGTVMKSRSRSEKRAMIRRFRDDVLPMMGKEFSPLSERCIRSHLHRMPIAGWKPAECSAKSFFAIFMSDAGYAVSSWTEWNSRTAPRQAKRLTAGEFYRADFCRSRSGGQGRCERPYLWSVEFIASSPRRLSGSIRS